MPACTDEGYVFVVWTRKRNTLHTLTCLNEYLCLGVRRDCPFSASAGATRRTPFLITQALVFYVTVSNFGGNAEDKSSGGKLIPPDL